MWTSASLTPALCVAISYGRSSISLHFAKTHRRFVCTVTMQYSEDRPAFLVNTIHDFRDGLVRGAKIGKALTATTGAKDLADAFAWFESLLQKDQAQTLLQHIRQRAKSLHSSITPDGSVPAPSQQALNNEVAYIIFRNLCHEFDVRLTGLCSAVHLTGREGVVRFQDPKSIERWNIRMDDGTYVSVRAVNFEHICRGG